MNYTKQIAEMLGVEIYEEFTMSGYERFKYRFTESDFEVYSDGSLGWESGSTLRYISLIKGTSEIIKTPKFPTAESYFFIEPDKNIYRAIWRKTIRDIYNFKVGNYFLTEEEITEEDIKRIVKMLNSPERLV